MSTDFDDSSSQLIRAHPSYPRFPSPDQLSAMPNTKRIFAAAVLLAFLTAPLPAETVTAIGTIEAVDAAARTITVRRKTANGEKTARLKIADDAEVAFDSEVAALDQLKTGQSVDITYDTTAKQVTKLEARSAGDKPAAPPARPELIETRELNPGQYPCLTEDGLTVFWERDGAIWAATRADADSSFADKRELFRGRHPTVTADGLEMVFLSSAGSSGEIFHATKRTNLGQAFGRAKVIAELVDERQAKCPSLAPDGLTLCFWRVGGEMVVCAHDEKGARWSKPMPLPIRSDGPPRSANWPQFAAAGLKLFCSGEGGGQLLSGHGNLMFSSRRTVAEPFAAPRTIDIAGLPPLSGRSPRYVAATRELFFTRAIIDNGKPNWVGIWAVKNFSPPTSTR